MTHRRPHSPSSEAASIDARHHTYTHLKRLLRETCMPQSPCHQMPLTAEPDQHAQTMRGFVWNALVDGLGSYVVYMIAHRHGSEFRALVWSMLPPAANNLWTLARKRHLDLFGVLVIGGPACRAGFGPAGRLAAPAAGEGLVHHRRHRRWPCWSRCCSLARFCFTSSASSPRAGDPETRGDIGCTDYDTFADQVRPAPHHRRLGHHARDGSHPADGHWPCVSPSPCS